jgi:hypothetical protein
MEPQTLDLQIDSLLQEGVLKDHIYQDLASGKIDDRPGLEACLKALRPGDSIIVWKLDRLGLNLRHLVNFKTFQSEVFDMHLSYLLRWPLKVVILENWIVGFFFLKALFKGQRNRRVN